MKSNTILMKRILGVLISMEKEMLVLNEKVDRIEEAIKAK